MFLSKENTWMQRLRKDQYIKGTKIIKDPLIRHSQEFLSDKFTNFDYTNDAIFESFRDYPRKKQLYRKHKDIAKDYERKVKFYKSCQRWYSTESTRHIQKVEERFSKLLHYTFESNIKKTTELQNSYSKWVSRHGKPTDLDKTFEQTIHRTLKTPKIGIREEAVETLGRIHSLRSVSVDNIPQVEEDNRTQNAHIGLTTDDNPQMFKSFSSLDIRHDETTKVRKSKHTVKITSN